MRPDMLSNATRLVVAMLVAVTALTGFAQARDWSNDRPPIRRHHVERNVIDTGIDRGQRERRSGVITSRSGRDWHRDDRRGRRDARDRSRNRDRDWRRVDDRGIVSRSGNRRYRDRDFREERRHVRHERHDRRAPGRDRRNGYGSGYIPTYNDDDFPSQTEAGTYFGGLSAWTDPGNGTYFRSRRNSYYDDRYEDRSYDEDRGGPKVIRVHPSRPGGGCSIESGVCVVRP